jgi:hypothetical protein
MGRSFPYAARAHAVEEARKALHESSAKWRIDRSEKSERDRQVWRERFHAALSLAYPPAFWSDIEKLRAGDINGLEAAIDFLEADPMFFRSGYVKAELLDLVKRFPMNDDQIGRLRAFILRVVRSRDDRDFRCYCRFSHHIDGADFRNALTSISANPDRDARRRALWVLGALDQADRTIAGSVNR